MLHPWSGRHNTGERSPSGNQSLPSGPTVSAPASLPDLGRGNSVTAPEGVIRPIAPPSGNQRLPSGPTASACGDTDRVEGELGDGARRCDPADRASCIVIRVRDKVLGEPEVAVGAHPQIAQLVPVRGEGELGDRRQQAAVIQALDAGTMPPIASRVPSDSPGMPPPLASRPVRIKARASLSPHLCLRPVSRVLD